MDNICLKIKEKFVKSNQLIEGYNFFLDGDNGNFGNLDNITTEMDNPAVDYDVHLFSKSSMRFEINEFGRILLEGDSIVTLEPNTEYYLTAYVFQNIDPPPLGNTDYYISFEKIGFVDALFANLVVVQLKPSEDGRWLRISAKLVTGVSRSGRIRIVQSGSYTQFVHGEVYNIDSVSIAKFGSYIGDVVSYGPEFNLRVDKSVDSTLILKTRDVGRPDLFFQRSKAREVVIPSTSEVEAVLGYAHDVGSIRGNKSFNREYIARLEVNSVEILSGLFTFESLSTVNCNDNSYKGKLISNSKFWMDLFAKANLCDLNWEEYNFTSTLNNLEPAWQVNGDTASYVPYLFEKRQTPYLAGNIYAFFTDDFNIGLFIKPFIRKLFRHIGYEVFFNGAFLNGDKFRDDFIAGLTTSISKELYKRFVIYFGYQTNPIVISPLESEVPNYSEFEFDPNSYITNNCVEKVTEFELNMTIHFEIWPGTNYDSPFGNATLYLPHVSIHDGLLVCCRCEYIFDPILAANSDHIYFIKVEFYTINGVISTQNIYSSQEPKWDTDSFNIIQTTDLGNGNWKIDFSDSFGGTYVHFFGRSILAPTSNDDFYVQLRKPPDPNDVGYIYEQAPKCIGLKSVISSIFKVYNLMSETNEATSTVHLWQRDDYFSQAQTPLIADEIATTEQIKQIKTSSKSKKIYSFFYAKNEIDSWFDENAPIGFGNFELDNSGGLASAQVVLMSEGNIFNASYDYEPFPDVWVPRYKNAINPISTVSDVDFGNRILHYGGIVPLAAPYKLEVYGNFYGLYPMNPSIGPVLPKKVFNSYPKTTFLDRDGFGDVNLCFEEREGKGGLFLNHFQDEFIIVTSSRIMSAYFYLDAEFIRNLNFGRFWKFKDSIFYLNKIIDFSFIEKTNTRVELIPINSFYGTDDDD